MKYHGTVATAACASWLVWSATANAQNPLAQFAFRVEVHPIQTLTLPDQQFLKGSESGARSVVIAGVLRIAQGTGRLPLVVMIHGSGGISALFDTWLSQFAERGISTFVLDGFTGRGLTGVNTDQSLLGRLNLILDAYRSLSVLAKHPRVDASRIAVMGFSRGGQAALYASMSRFQRAWNTSGVEFTAYIPFYPDCSTTYLTDTDVTSRPIRIFHGIADDYNPIAPCRAYVDKLRAAGRDVQITEYAGAHHSFDNPLGNVPAAIVPNAQTVRHCSIREQPMGQLMNAVTGQLFTYNDACVELNPHTGYDPMASRVAHQAVEDLLREVFHLH